MCCLNLHWFDIMWTCIFLDHCLYFLVGREFDSLTSISLDFCRQCKTASYSGAVGVQVSPSLFFLGLGFCCFCVHISRCAPVCVRVLVSRTFFCNWWFPLTGLATSWTVSLFWMTQWSINTFFKLKNQHNNSPVLPSSSKWSKLLCSSLFSVFVNLPVLCWALVFLQGWSLPISLHVCEMTRWGRSLSSKIRPRFVTVLPCRLALPPTSCHYLSICVCLPLPLSVHPYACGVASTHPCPCSTPCIQIHSPKMHCQCRRCRSHCYRYVCTNCI